MKGCGARLTIAPNNGWSVVTVTILTFWKSLLTATEKYIIMVLLSNGVAELTNAQNALSGAERMPTALNRDSGAGPKAMLSGVMAVIDAFVADAEQFNDITMLCIRI